MIIKLSAFQGESPRTIPRLLPESMAQQAYNTKLENGALKPIHRARFVEALSDTAQTIYLHKGEWISWQSVVDVVPGPVADDRLYFTGDGAPKLMYQGQVYTSLLLTRMVCRSQALRERLTQTCFPVSSTRIRG